MDMYCATCGEPWDTEHLQQDLVYEVGATEAEAERWLTLPRTERLSSFYRGLFQSEGWEFGGSLYDIRRCPACPKGAKPNPETETYRNLVVELLGDDEDGMAIRFRDFPL